MHGLHVKNVRIHTFYYYEIDICVAAGRTRVEYIFSFPRMYMEFVEAKRERATVEMFTDKGVHWPKEEDMENKSNFEYISK